MRPARLSCVALPGAGGSASTRSGSLWVAHGKVLDEKPAQCDSFALDDHTVLPFTVLDVSGHAFVLPDVTIGPLARTPFETTSSSCGLCVRPWRDGATCRDSAWEAARPDAATAGAVDVIGSVTSGRFAPAGTG